MINFLKVLLIAGYVVFAVWGAIRLTRYVAPAASRRKAGAIVFVALLAAPLADDIVGGIQFRLLCDEDKIFTRYGQSIRGRVMFTTVYPVNVEREYTAVRIAHTRTNYRDPDTLRMLVTTDRYVANGGWLAQVLAGSTGADPLTFPAACDGNLQIRQFKVKLVDPPVWM